MIDPLQAVWDALERGGYAPRGPRHDFRARCPAHDGDNASSLHVSVGADGRALLRCFARECAAEDIAAVLDLAITDLFPPGHRRARRRRLPEASRSSFTGNARTVANVLAAVDRLGADWYLELRADCMHCGSPAALVVASPRSVFLSCPSDVGAEELGYTPCTLDQFTQALAARLEDHKFKEFHS